MDITIYRLIGGIDPSKALSITLDVGTNNEDLLNDPLYVVSYVSHNTLDAFYTFNHGRDGLKDEFVAKRTINSSTNSYSLCANTFPTVRHHPTFIWAGQSCSRSTGLLHFEDFGVTNAERLLELYRDHHSCFNDDM